MVGIGNARVVMRPPTAGPHPALSPRVRLSRQLAELRGRTASEHATRPASTPQQVAFSPRAPHGQVVVPKTEREATALLTQLRLERLDLEEELDVLSFEKARVELARPPPSWPRTDAAPAPRAAQPPSKPRPPKPPPTGPAKAASNGVPPIGLQRAIGSAGTQQTQRPASGASSVGSTLTSAGPPRRESQSSSAGSAKKESARNLGLAAELAALCHHRRELQRELGRADLALDAAVSRSALGDGKEQKHQLRTRELMRELAALDLGTKQMAQELLAHGHVLKRMQAAERAADGELDALSGALAAETVQVARWAERLEFAHKAAATMGVQLGQAHLEHERKRKRAEQLGEIAARSRVAQDRLEFSRRARDSAFATAAIAAAASAAPASTASSETMVQTSSSSLFASRQQEDKGTTIPPVVDRSWGRKVFSKSITLHADGDEGKAGKALSVGQLVAGFDMLALYVRVTNADE
ncbi:hypothetical protein T492DRAFT_887941, partial [Pavlovales sp. CCMP2436]